MKLGINQCSRCGGSDPNCYVCRDIEPEEATEEIEATPMEDRWDYDHGPDHIREVIEDREPIALEETGPNQ